MVKGLGVADDAAKSRSGGSRKGEEVVVDGEEELADDVDCRVAEEVVEVAGDGTVEGVLEGDDGAIGGVILEGGEGCLHVGAGEDGRRGRPRRRPPGNRSLGRFGRRRGLGDIAAGRGGRRVVTGAEDLTVLKEVLEGHLEDEAGGEVLDNLQRSLGPCGRAWLVPAQARAMPCRAWSAGRTFRARHDLF